MLVIVMYLVLHSTVLVLYFVRIDESLFTDPLCFREIFSLIDSLRFQASDRWIRISIIYYPNPDGRHVVRAVHAARAVNMC